MIRKLKSGEYRLYSQKKDARTGKRRNLGKNIGGRAQDDNRAQKQDHQRKNDKRIRTVEGNPDDPHDAC